MSGLQAPGLRRTLPLVFAKKARIAEEFYRSMFRHAPETRVHFTGGFGRQKAILATVLVKIVQLADNPGALDQIAHGLLRSHRHYSVTPSQYQAARRALTEALTLHLSDGLSGEELQSWTTVADTLVQRMIDLSG